MDTRVDLVAGEGRPWDILAPAAQSVPLVLASPHSGTDYPADFLAVSRLDRMSLRRSEDSFVDEIFAAAPEHGAPLLRARFARAYVDANREAFELDPAMFEDDLPEYVNTVSPRVVAGLGTVARVVSTGAEIYRHKLRFSDALDRINRLYRPYHDALRRLVEATRRRFGYCLLIDCHSMPSVGGPMDRDSGRRRVDFVLGDRFGAACAPVVTATAQEILESYGYVVKRNTPYAGGFTTHHYGRPGEGLHALQIEINRALYMHEDRFERRPYLKTLSGHMRTLTAALAALPLNGAPPR